MRTCALMLVLAAAVSLHATTCISPPPCSVVRKDAIIFLAELLARTDLPERTTGVRWSSESGPVLLRFQVNEAFAGLTRKQAVVIAEAFGGGIWKPGTHYVVDSRRTPGGGMAIDPCSATGPADEASALVDYLRARKAGIGETSLTVFVGGDDPQRAPGIDVVADGPVSRTGVTDAEGRVRFTGIPAGSYRARLTAPGHIPVDSSPADVLDRACADLHLKVRWKSSLNGTVRDASGNPLAGVRIRLHRPDEPDHDGFVRFSLGKHQVTNPGGGFRFAGMAPGDYVLRVERAGHPTRFYPTARGADAATRIRIVPGSPAMPEISFFLPEDPAPRTIRIRAVDARGRPIRYAIVLDEAAPGLSRFDDDSMSAEDGILTLRAPQDPHYRIRVVKYGFPEASPVIDIPPGAADLDLTAPITPLPPPALP